MKSEELSKSFIISYMINCIFFLIAMPWAIWIFTSIFHEYTITSINLLGVLIGLTATLCSFVISLGILIVTTVLGIKNLKKTISSNTKRKIIVMLSVLDGLHVLMLVFWVVRFLIYKGDI